MAKHKSRIDDANVANVMRATHAVNALMVLLRRDPRVQEAYEVWRHAVAVGRFQQIVDHAHRLVREDLGLSYSWLPQLLMQDFAARPAHLVLEPEVPPDWPPGKEKGGAALIVRHVEWFYRVKIKHRKDSKRSVARERLRTLGPRASDGRATVHAAIVNVERLLAVFDLDDDPPLPK